MNETLKVVTILLMAVAAGEWLSRTRVGGAIGGALIVIALGSLLSNTGILPRTDETYATYGVLISVGAPVSIFLMLLDARLTALRRAGLPMLAAFTLGALGTVIGVVAASSITGAADWLGRFGAPLTGMYVATYVGGSANFNALALYYGVVDEPLLFASANAVDNVFTGLWMAGLLVLPPLLRRLAPSSTSVRAADSPAQPPAAPALHEQRPDLLGMAVLIAMGFAAYLGADWASAWFSRAIGWSVPSILILTTFALVAAQMPVVHRLSGAHTLAVYGAYLFLCVIGAYCDFGALAGMGRLAVMLPLFVGLAIALHGAFLFGVGLLLKADPDVLAIASTANIGGSTTVLPLAQSLNRMELLLPGVLVGALGSALGTYLGFSVVALIGGSAASPS